MSRQASLERAFWFLWASLGQIAIRFFVVKDPLVHAAAKVIEGLPRERISQMAGALAEKTWPGWLGRRVVAAYQRAYDVDLGDCTEREWPSFDAFFTRKLRPGARPIASDEGVSVSPADGRLDALGPVTSERTFVVKGRPYRVGELLGSESSAAAYEGGMGCVIYLSPRDYHRVHAPVAGRIRVVRSIAGDFFPVNDMGIRHVPELFVRNRRVAIELETQLPDGVKARAAVIMVVAMIVGRITVTSIDGCDVPVGDHFPNVRVDKGGEIGTFHLGSTAVVVFDKHWAGKWQAGLGAIRLGEPLLRRPL
jgi:phosphatidylserine decarboxylase